MIVDFNNSKYLTGIPQEMEEFGLCKTYMVRHEIIHIKHIMTEIFAKKAIDIQKYLDIIGWSLMDYMEYLTHRIRHIHYFDRGFRNSIDEIIKNERGYFFKDIALYDGFNNVIALDFDGVVTENSFRELYDLCLDRCKTVICSANPTITEDYFHKREMRLPKEINSRKGKVAKIKCLIELMKKHENVFYVDNEIEYLTIAWLFGIKTYHYRHGKIYNFSLKRR